MKELLDKLSSYNIFNYLFPGVVFVVVLSRITQYNLIQDNQIVGAFFYYFIGLIISRVGSLIIEPILKKTSFVVFSDYSEYVKASKVDNKIEILSEENNMYRTVCSLILLEITFVAYEKLSTTYSISGETSTTFLLFILFIVFLFSYKKQTNYVTKRIKTIDITSQNDE